MKKIFYYIHKQTFPKTRLNYGWVILHDDSDSLNCYTANGPDPQDGSTSFFPKSDFVDWLLDDNWVFMETPESMPTWFYSHITCLLGSYDNAFEELNA